MLDYVDAWILLRILINLKLCHARASITYFILHLGLAKLKGGFIDIIEIYLFCAFLSAAI